MVPFVTESRISQQTRSWGEKYRGHEEEAKRTIKLIDLSKALGCISLYSVCVLLHTFATSKDLTLHARLFFLVQKTLCLLLLAPHHQEAVSAKKFISGPLKITVKRNEYMFNPLNKLPPTEKKALFKISMNISLKKMLAFVSY